MVEPEQGLDDARAWIGFKLDELGGRSVGRVEGVLVDAEDGGPAWLLVKTGLLRGHSAVPFDQAAAGVGHVWVPHPRETIKGAPQVDPGAGLDRDAELAMFDHYGVPPGARRRGSVEARAAGLITAVPDAVGD